MIAADATQKHFSADFGFGRPFRRSSIMAQHNDSSINPSGFRECGMGSVIAVSRSRPSAALRGQAWGAARGDTGRRERVVAGDLGSRRFGCDEASRRATPNVLRDLLLEIPVEGLDAARETRPVMTGTEGFDEERPRHYGDSRISREWVFLARSRAVDNGGGLSRRSTKRC